MPMTMVPNLILLTAPPAAGKTFLVETLHQVFAPDFLLLVPLRAIADECHGKWGKNCRVMTPEEWLLRPVYSSVVVVDEYHLWEYWGNTFRPALWEAFYGLAEHCDLMLLLTATLPPWMKDHLMLGKNHFAQMWWTDFGNQKFKFFPQHYLQAPNSKWIKQWLMTYPFRGTVLVFCAYRHEVKSWERELAQIGKTVWSCVGGEAAQFAKVTKDASPPDFIVATTVLSHGVNLPRLSWVVFLYKVENPDFWLQMVARGGRRGEAYQVMALERPVGFSFNPWLNRLAMLRLSFTIKWQQFCQDLAAWFLKD